MPDDDGKKDDKPVRVRWQAPVRGGGVLAILAGVLVSLFVLMGVYMRSGVSSVPLEVVLIVLLAIYSIAFLVAFFYLLFREPHQLRSDAYNSNRDEIDHKRELEQLFYVERRGDADDTRAMIDMILGKGKSKPRPKKRGTNT